MFATNLKLILNDRGKTPKELAKYVGVKPSVVNAWLNKGASPKVEHLYKISDFLNVSLDYLFNGIKKGSINEVFNSNIIQGNQANNLIVRNDQPVKMELGEMELEILQVFKRLSLKNRALMLFYIYHLEEKEFNKGGNIIYAKKRTKKSPSPGQRRRVNHLQR